jgi:ubiquinone/menaquinone biosynthesis C-methylase UbiE
MAYVISELNLERQKLLGKVLTPVTDKLLSALQLPSGVRGLDLGCGMGETTRQLARTLDKPNEIVGLELNPDLVETAKKLSSGEQDGVSFEQGDVSTLEFADNSFDFVFARYLLMHLSSQKQFLKRCCAFVSRVGWLRSKSRIFHFNAVTRTVGHMSAFQTCSAGFSPTLF